MNTKQLLAIVVDMNSLIEDAEETKKRIEKDSFKTLIDSSSREDRVRDIKTALINSLDSALNKVSETYQTKDLKQIAEAKERLEIVYSVIKDIYHPVYRNEFTSFY